MAFLVCFWVEKEQTGVKYMKPGENTPPKQADKTIERASLEACL